MLVARVVPRRRRLDRRLRRLGRRHAAELLVVDQLLDRRVGAAHRAIRILAQLQLAEAHLQRVVDHEAADQRLADAEDDLHRLGRLDHADDAGQHAEHAALGAARDQPRRRRLGIEAAVARAVLGAEHRRLALEAEDRAVGVRDAEQHAGVVHQVARREVVGAVEDDVVALEDLERVLRRERLAVGQDVDLRVDRVDLGLRRFQLRAADVGRRVDDLALQVRQSTTSKSTMPMVPTPAAAR